MVSPACGIVWPKEAIDESLQEKPDASQTESLVQKRDRFETGGTQASERVVKVI